MRSLPLTVFEEYLFHENQAHYPCNICIRTRFSGKLQRDQLAQAVAKVAPLHPHLTATVERGLWGRLRWKFNSSAEIPIHWLENQTDSFRPDFGSFDPEKETAFHLYVVYEPNKWDLYVNQSHSLCDGAGFFQFLHDLMIAYDQCCGNDRAQLPITDLPRLKRRGSQRFRLGSFLSIIPIKAAGFLIALSLFRRQVSPLLPSRDTLATSPYPKSSPHLVSRYLGKETYFHFRKSAREMGISINDLFLAAFHAAIGSWRASLGEGEPADWIRLSVPVNLRLKADNSLPACNAISIISIDRQAKGLSNRSRLLRRAKEDMQYVKKGRLGTIYLSILWIRRFLPGGIRSFSHRDICRTSATLTNLGHQFPHSPLKNSNGRLETGGSTLERITSAAPYRRHAQATLLMAVYAGELEATLNYDPRAICKEEAENLIDSFVSELRIMTQIEDT